MKTTTPLGRGVQNRASTAERLCHALESRAGKIDRTLDGLFSRFLGTAGLRFNLQPLLIFLARVIHYLLGHLLERENAHQGALAAAGEALARRDRAVGPVRRKMRFFREVGLRILSPVIPKGPIARTPSTLLEEALAARRRLHRCPFEGAPDLPAGVELSPALRTALDGVVAELEAAIADLETRRQWVNETRRTRDLAMAELDLYLKIGGDVGKVLGALPGDDPACAPGEPRQEDPPNRNQKGASHGKPWS